jgi:uncharacterized repeat protein (TIGR01451 family)
MMMVYFSYAQDTIPPSLIDITIDPNVVDVSDAIQMVNITMSLTDDLSGVQGTVSVPCNFPNGTNYFGGASRISGTSTNGVWRTSIPVSQGMPVGFAKINIVVSDAVGNVRNYSFQDLKNLGFDSDFEIVNSKLRDTIPPSLFSINIDPNVVDISDSSQIAMITMSLTDDLSGIKGTVSAACIFPNGTTFFGSAVPVSGTPTNGVWSASIPISLGMPPGFAKINIGIIDAAGNFRNYNSQDLKDLGFDSDFEIVNSSLQDTISPSLFAITVNPEVVDISDSSQVVTINMSLTDDLSGVKGTVSVACTFPNGTTYFGSGLLIAGTSTNGEWRAFIPVSFGMPSGFANINIGIVDAVGNMRNYSFQNLRQLGLDHRFEIVNSIFRLKGRTIYDENLDGCNDMDRDIPYLKFRISNENYIETYIAELDGRFLIPVLEGKNLITPIIEFPEAFDVTPLNFEIEIPSTSDTVIQNFCISPKGLISQTNITIIPLTPPARPGFDASYKIVWKNVGTQIESGTLYFTYDENIFDYVSADLSPDAINSGKLSWDYTDLLPFEKREIIVTLNLNSPMETPPVNVGDITYLYANILDNVFRLENVIVGSYDPNDKTCLQGQYFHPDSVGKYVDFLIRFENTGNFAAENVVIKDIIDDKTFDVSSLLITDASHEVYTRIVANKVEFIFENIQLPFEDETNDGYIAFKIKTKSTLKLGDEMKNLADIYFDYNFPIRTNETQTTIAIPSGTKDIQTEVTIHPNPVRDVLTLDSSTRWTKAEIFYISGRLIKVTGVDGYSVDVNGLESGTYILHLSDKDKRGRVKFVKM